jgi:import inner membrane translocase subunit TIM21
VFTLLYLELFSPNSKTWQFEKAVERIKDDPECIKLLGDRREIKAYGENTWSRWARNRPIA